MLVGLWLFQVLPVLSKSVCHSCGLKRGVVWLQARGAFWILIVLGSEALAVHNKTSNFLTAWGDGISVDGI